MIGRLRRFFDTTPGPDPARLLAQAYQTEVRLARQLGRHAEMLGRYPWLRDAVRALAAESEATAARLAREFGARPGAETAGAAPPHEPASHWERLRQDVADLRAAAEWYASAAYDLERDHPALARLMLALRARKMAGWDRLGWLLARVDRAGLDRPEELAEAARAAPPEPEPTPVAGRLDIDGMPLDRLV